VGPQNSGPSQVGEAVIGELGACAAHRTRRVLTRTTTKNQLLGQLDRAFPGLSLVLLDVLGTKIGRLVAAEFADPRRLAALGASRLIRFAALRGLQVRRPLAERLVEAARDALNPADATTGRGGWLVVRFPLPGVPGRHVWFRGIRGQSLLASPA
jgi:transposase